MSSPDLDINHQSQAHASDLDTFDFNNINWESLNQLTEDLLPTQPPYASYVTSTARKDHDLNYPEVDRHNSVDDWLRGLSADDHGSSFYQQMIERECGQQEADSACDEFPGQTPSVVQQPSNSVFVSTPMFSSADYGSPCASSSAINMMLSSTVFECDETSQSSSIASHSSGKSTSGSGQRFWQYNILSKGPKVKKFNLNVSVNTEVDQKAMEFTDPVFNKEVSDVTIPHVGKARKGTGTVLTPDPMQLYKYGRELESLQANIRRLQGDKKEKNRRISKACRLKKNANHEANKVKYYLLKKEQGELQELFARMGQVMKTPGSGPLTPLLDSFKSSLYQTRVAGNLTQAVDQVIDNVAQGDPTGGIHNLKTSDAKDLSTTPHDFTDIL